MANFCDPSDDLRDKIGVKIHLGLLIEGAPKMQSTLDLAATEHRGHLLFECLLFGPKFLGQSELHIEIAVIDGPQFPRQSARPRVGGLPCKACHTV